MNGKPSQSNDADMLAHVRADAAGAWHVHGLSEHLRAVAALAGDFAADPAGRLRVATTHRQLHLGLPQPEDSGRWQFRPCERAGRMAAGYAWGPLFASASKFSTKMRF